MPYVISLVLSICVAWLVVCMSHVFRVWCFFFFQAEDGIRDLVRSRGLGDVYKRQAECGVGFRQVVVRFDFEQRQAERPADRQRRLIAPVSYTHLTLPTSDLV